jgi:L-alanine-DL-glutamate epimerase-like enolase superfamily enzyme
MMLGMNRRNFLSTAGIAGAAVVSGVVPSLSPLLGAVAGNLKITGIETDVLRFAPGKPFADAIHNFGPDRGGTVLRILTNAGITGWAYSSFGMIAGGPRVVETILQEELKPVLMGKDPAFPKRLRADMWSAIEYQGVQGVTQYAMAAVDIALWDILGKAAGMPVYKMIGAFRERMPVYAMNGWYYEKDSDLSQFRKSIASALEEGFHAVKIKVGRGTIDEDVERIRAAQELCGKDRRVMVDANQVFNRNEALRRGRVYQQMNCFWLEEPLPPYDRDGYSELAHALDIRIATGENEYTKYPFLELIKHGGVDVVQPDNRRAGGLTEWMEIAAIADAYGIEVASHGGGPTNLHMLLAMPNAIYMETGSLKGDSSNVEKLRMENGEVFAPVTPGMGSELRRDWIQKYKV